MCAILRYDDMKNSIRKLDYSKFRSHEVRFGLLYTPSSAFNGVKHILLRLVHSVTLCYVPFSRYPENFVHILPYQFPSDLLYVRRTLIILCRTDFCLLFSPIELRFFCGLISIPQPQNNNKQDGSPILIYARLLKEH